MEKVADIIAADNTEEIFFDGRSRGAWGDSNIARLARKLGVSVNELRAQTAAHNGAMKAARRVKKAVEKRAGDDAKILALTADGASVSLLLNAALIGALAGAEDLAGYKANLDAALDAVLPTKEEGRSIKASLADFAQKVEAGDIQIVANIRGADSVMTAVGDCNNSVAGVLAQAAAAKKAAAEIEAPA